MDHDLSNAQAEIARLTACLARANDNHEKFERLWYLVQDERDAYRAMLCDLLASASPHPVEHPTMTRQWARARALLKNGNG